MTQRLGSPNWRAEMWAEIFDRARKKGRVFERTLGEHNFQYALINSADRYGRISVSTTGAQYRYSRRSVTFWIKDEESDELHAGVCYGPGLNFVFEANTPAPFRDYVGLHEHIESEFLVNPKSHTLACSAELGEVFRRETKFVGAYARWLVELHDKSKTPEKGYFTRAVPDFMRILREGKLSPLEMLQEFKERVDSIKFLNVAVSK